MSNTFFKLKLKYMSKSSWSRKVATPAAAPAVIKLTPLDSFLNDLRKKDSTDIDCIALSKEIINFDVDLVNRGSLTQQRGMRHAVDLVASSLDKSSSENTSLAIDNLCQISALYNITLNSKQILDFATKRLGEASQPAISRILHSLVHCGLNQEHCTKYGEEILAAFITSSNIILGAPW
ncbi:MAG: hypothetical protein EXR06_03510, partial [Rickettsiales bacterium]|nr:hypothetical protein [Rickettsiales bacterium]